MSNHTRDLRETLIWVFIVITSIFMTGYYDIVLGLIPLALAGITGVLVLAGFALTTAIPLASVVAVGLIGHAMFVRTPVDSPPARREPGKTAD
ncbi:hypothetical protein SAMN05216559_2825 [Halomicrobium zhouii]|uniref:Uncharacterized protein n=2 Tax=Halomicrobium zhouii TaxID=767519 RepID=A0A1I6LJM6_9EURY|nr:hypothetical protein SAMN05216559_2825 [Halomicrobium zhouii]